jgi:phage terminase large subunit-like protein
VTPDGIYFDAASVALDFAFIESLTLTKSTKSGGPEPFRLLKPHRKLVANLLGWKRADGTRLYRRAYFSPARKNAKTQVTAAIGLDLLVMDPEAEPEIYAAAKTAEQSSMIFKAAAGMVQASEELSDLLQITTYRREIRNRATGGVMVSLTADGKAKHGSNPSVVLLDEFHVWGPAEQELYDALTSGSAARRQPLTIIITTAGLDEQSMCGVEYEYARRVRDGIIEDPTYLPMIYEVPKDADWTDESLWHLANPTLGDIVSLDYLREECDRAKKKPAEQTKFRRLCLNQWVNAASTWIPRTQWDACSWNGSDPIPVTAGSTSPQ